MRTLAPPARPQTAPARSRDPSARLASAGSRPRRGGRRGLGGPLAGKLQRGPEERQRVLPAASAESTKVLDLQKKFSEQQTSRCSSLYTRDSGLTAGRHAGGAGYASRCRPYADDENGKAIKDAKTVGDYLAGAGRPIPSPDHKAILVSLVARLRQGPGRAVRRQVADHLPRRHVAGHRRPSSRPGSTLQVTGPGRHLRRPDQDLRRRSTRRCSRSPASSSPSS